MRLGERNLESDARAPSQRATPSRAPSSRAPAALPSSGSRALDRDKVLERYRRPSVPSADRTAREQVDATLGRARSPEPISGARRSAEDVARARESVRDTTLRASERAVLAADRAGRDRSSRIPMTRASRDALAGTPERAVADGRRNPDARATQVKNARDLYRAEQGQKLDRRAASVAEQRTRRMRDLAATNPRAAQDLWNDCQKVSSCNGWGFTVGVSLGFGWCSPWGSYWASCWPSSWWWNSWGFCGSWGYWWGYGGYPYSWCTHPFGWSSWWYWGYWPYHMSSWWPSYYNRYYYSPVVYYSSYLADPYYDDPDVVIYDYDDDNDVVYEQGGSEQGYAQGRSHEQGGDARVTESETGEGVRYPPQATARTADDTVSSVLERGPDTRARAAAAYLEDGDRAFRERRYGDAAHFYAKAIEFRPDDGVLYLVLADALFATGDYHYGAFALRRALELDPDLARSEIDKYAFYNDPTELDRQLQVLERFLADHPTDADARLLLSANYLFAKKPKLAIDLLESGASDSVRNEPAGKLVLEAAKELDKSGL
jgi:hypothetical protein